MKVGLVVASLALVVGSATACSDSASTEEFCSGYQNFADSLFQISSDDSADYINALKEAADDFGVVGAPDDMPDDAKAGLELNVATFSELDDDATLSDLGDIEAEFSEEELQNTEAFGEYLAETCPDIVSRGGGGRSLRLRSPRAARRSRSPWRDRRPPTPPVRRRG